MAKTLIDVDDTALSAAAEILDTTTKKDTVNEALREVVALAARRRDLARLAGHDLLDLEDPAIMQRAWQR